MNSYYDYVKIAGMLTMVLMMLGPTNTLLVLSGYSHGFISTLRLVLAGIGWYWLRCWVI